MAVYRNDFASNGKPEDEVYFMGGGVTGVTNNGRHLGHHLGFYQ